MERGVIFVRVSKKEQNFQKQIKDLREVAHSQRVEIIKEISEKFLGAKGNIERQALQELFSLAKVE